MMRVLALTRYERLGSSSRVRFYQYYPYLQARGMDIVTAPFFNDEYVRALYRGQAVSKAEALRAYSKRLSVLIKSTSFDLLWVEKELFPWVPAWMEGLLESINIPYVVDYDDAVYHRYDQNRSSIVRGLLGRKIDRVMRHAALVVVGNEYLAERAGQAGARRIEYLPSVVDVSHYRKKTGSTGSPFRIGWVGSPVTAPYLDQIRDSLETFSQEMDVHLTLIGSGDIRPFPGISTTIQAWNEEMELSIGEMFDVGIMPLVDGPFERGKCGYKLVQYMAAGLPVIASPIGVNSQMVIPGTNGYLAGSPGEWLEAFRRLANDTELRLKMGKSGRRLAEQMYNLQGTAPRLFDLLASAQRA
jgi:glycosyltransferase involved in cell wall biosynthesis